MDWLEREAHREYHEFASIFPLMEGDNYEALKTDIEANGLLEAIWLDSEGRIIDGRNRHKACLDLGIKPDFRTWQGEGSLISFIVSLNLHRRHLTSSQRAAIALDVLPKLEEEARQRQATSAPGVYGGEPLKEKIPEAVGQARDHAAKLFNTNPRYVSDAKKLAEEAPDLLDQVKSGEKSILAARHELSRRQYKEPPPMPTTQHRVIYADPPWQYAHGGMSKYGHADQHYPTMSVDDLCNLRPQIDKLAAPDCVLFLWATSPKLVEGLRVMDAWGFEYKTSFVWDKVEHNFGHYNSVRHEFLLIGGKGRSAPDNGKLFDSVQSISRSESHSEKPEQFRQIIDSLYSYGNRIELFARREVDGWESWGNE